MIPSTFDYAAPESLSEALSLLGSNSESKILAGGQSLIPLLKLRLAAPGQLIDLGNIADLHVLAESEGVIHIGAMTTHYQVESSELLKEKCPLLAETAASIGDVQVRNRGTIGGSVAHADPAADYPAALLALEAKVKLVSSNGERVLSVDEFLVDALMTAIEPGEILTELQAPAEASGTGAAYRTQVQPASGYAVAGVAARLRIEGGNVALARVGVTGVASKAYRATAVENALEGKPASAEAIAEAAAHAADGVEPLEDLHGTAAYRAHLARVWTRRALEAALERAAS